MITVQEYKDKSQNFFSNKKPSGFIFIYLIVDQLEFILLDQILIMKSTLKK